MIVKFLNWLNKTHPALKIIIYVIIFYHFYWMGYLIGLLW